MIYNSLINDSRLIDFCKKHGYKLIFKPHPNVYRFIELFETNDYVIIDSTSNSYNDIFYTCFFDNNGLFFNSF